MQGIFTSDGWVRMWEELLRDQEVVERDVGECKEEEEEDREKQTATFDSIMETWTWGNRPPTSGQVQRALQEVVREQLALSRTATLTMPSMLQLHQRLLVLERIFEAVVRKGQEEPGGSDTDAVSSLKRDGRAEG